MFEGRIIEINLCLKKISYEKENYCSQLENESYLC